jgi:hypothetical protein
MLIMSLGCTLALLSYWKSGRLTPGFRKEASQLPVRRCVEEEPIHAVGSYTQPSPDCQHANSPEGVY